MFKRLPSACFICGKVETPLIDGDWCSECWTGGEEDD